MNIEPSAAPAAGSEEADRPSTYPLVPRPVEYTSFEQSVGQNLTCYSRWSLPPATGNNKLKDDPEFAIQLDDIMANRMIQKINYIDWKREITEIVQLIEAELNK